MIQGIRDNMNKVWILKDKRKGKCGNIRKCILKHKKDPY